MEFETSGRSEQLPGLSPSHKGATILYDWNAQIRMGLIMGDPVISVRFKWDLIGGVVTLPRIGESGGDAYETRNLDDLPSAARELVGIYDVKLRLTLRGPGGQRYDLIEDVGVPDKPGADWSFNVPGNPDWDQVFIRKGSSHEGDYYSEDAARAIWRDGLVLEWAQIEAASLSLSDLHTWYYRNNPQDRIRALDEAISRLNQGVNYTFGFDTKAFEPLENWHLNKMPWDRAQETLQQRERTFEKLMNVDKKWGLGANPAPYEEARRQAQLILRTAETRQLQLTGVGPSLEGQRGKGYAPTFSGNYKIETDADGVEWIVRKDNGQRLREVEHGEALAGSYSFNRWPRCDESGRAKVELKDVETRSVLYSTEVSCVRSGTSGVTVMALGGEDELAGFKISSWNRKYLGEMGRCGGTKLRYRVTSTVLTADASLNVQNRRQTNEEVIEAQPRICFHVQK
ncbi:hypothetical protein [Aestuariivita boseongensis]|uniref:hypothetical protein n=1 Tax=Aestuariivita boseongensis TaxID=1470562 RepID=UPI00155DD1ED|nr:hypothetical protein [Aestuariivita boseongensis]